MDKTVLLYVDDDKDARDIMLRVVKTHWPTLTIYEADNAGEGLEMYIKHRPDIVITDMVMPVHNGYWLIEQIRAIRKDVLIVVMSGYYNTGDFLNTPGIIAVPKPIEPKYLLSIIANCVEQIKLNREFKTLVGAIINGSII